MKRLFFPLFFIAALSGCVAVPYEQSDVVYLPTPVYVAPAYSAPVYVGPPVQLRFEYRSGGGPSMAIAMASGITATEATIVGMAVVGMEDIESDNKKPAEPD